MYKAKDMKPEQKEACEVSITANSSTSMNGKSVALSDHKNYFIVLFEHDCDCKSPLLLMALHGFKS